MNYLHQIPLARLVVPLMVGIACAFYFPQPVGVWFYPFAVAALLALAFLSYKGSNYARWSGLVITIFFLLLGVKLVEVNTQSAKYNYVGQYLQDYQNYLIVKLDEPVQEKAHSVKAIANIEAIRVGEEWKPVVGKLLLYFSLDQTALAMEYGDRLLLKANIEEIKPPLNPGQFDNKSYLARKGIYHQAYLKPENFVITENHVGSSLMTWVYAVRSKLLWYLREGGLTGSELAVTSALVLGYDDDIDNELLQAYSASGTMHVLSVSGMHAGIIYIILAWLLGFMGVSKAARVSRALIIIIAIWLYALVTGFSPPVIRAAIMFSLLAWGKSLNRYTNTYNILAGSCLLMLLYNPFLLADTGFQLSYIAVFGIALTYPMITGWFEPKYWLVEKAWEITAMSLAAQLATFPLALFYFHQFPNYFIISNLIIIPLSSLVLLGGIALLVVSFIPIVAVWLGYVLGKMVWALNWLVLYSEQLPYSVAKNFNISAAETLILYFIIIALIVAFKTEKKKWLYVSLVSLTVYMGFRIIKNVEALQQEKLVVYNVNKAQAIEVIAGNTSVLLVDSAALPGTINYRFNINAAQWYFGIDNRSIDTASYLVFSYKPLLVYNNKTIVLIDKGFKGKNISKVKNADYVIVSGNPYIDYKLLQSLQPKCVVFDATNKPTKIKYWAKELDKLGIAHYNVATQGAFVVDL